MAHPVTQAAASALFVALAGYLVWAPTGPIWMPIVDGVPWPVVLGGVIAACVLLGAAFARVTGVTALPFAVGGLVVYVVSMYWIGVAIEPDSPVHLLLYGFFLACGVAGVAGATAVADRNGRPSAASGS